MSRNTTPAWNTKYGPRRVRHDPPTVAEAIAAAKDIADEREAQIDIAASLMGVPREQVVLAEDGVVVDLVDGVARIVGAVPCGYVYVDGSSVGEFDEALLKDRRILRDEGFISVIVVIDSATGKIAAGPEIQARGFAEDDEIFSQVRPKIEQALAELGGSLADVVRTRMFITRPEDHEAVGRAHGERFADIRPVTSMLVVAALIDPRWRVEIEADAVLGSR